MKAAGKNLDIESCCFDFLNYFTAVELLIMKNIEEKIIGLKARSSAVYKVLEHLYGDPIIDAQKLSGIIAENRQSAYQLIKKMKNAGILVKITGAERNRLYIFADYLKIFEDRNIR